MVSGRELQYLKNLIEEIVRWLPADIKADSRLRIKYEQYCIHVRQVLLIVFAPCSEMVASLLWLPSPTTFSSYNDLTIKILI